MGVKRTLQCLCQEGCDLKCPFAVLETLVSYAVLKGNEGAYLAVTNKGTRATKSDIIKAWRKLYGPDTTGHSARRFGALQYTRSGWAVSQLGQVEEQHHIRICSSSTGVLSSQRLPVLCHDGEAVGAASLSEHHPTLGHHKRRQSRQRNCRSPQDGTAKVQAGHEGKQRQPQLSCQGTWREDENGKQIPATLGQVHKTPAAAQEQQSSDLRPRVHVENDLRVALLFSKLHLWRGRGLEVVMRKVPTVSAAARRSSLLTVGRPFQSSGQNVRSMDRCVNSTQIFGQQNECCRGVGRMETFWHRHKVMSAK